MEAEYVAAAEVAKEVIYLIESCYIFLFNPKLLIKTNSHKYIPPQLQ